MIKINENFAKIPETYLFSEVAYRIKTFKRENPQVDIIRMDIGDVTRPICQVAVDALRNAAEEMGAEATFHGYGPEQGYDFLRKRIAFYDYKNRGIDIDETEIFISDGAKSDIGNISDIFDVNCKIAVTDPVYPVYVDTNIMAGRAGTYENKKWSRIEYLSVTAENNFLPSLPREFPDIIYLCYPNNPTGTALTHYQLTKWVDYAIKHNCLILFDSAYEAYISTPDIPHSIYEIEGAKEVAIEFRSFSKTAGFTGLRCGYTVVPNSLKGVASSGKEYSLNRLWNRRQCTKFNGVSYPVQRAAEALYSEIGQHQVEETIDYYRRNARSLRDGLAEAGFKVYGGLHSPYVWVKTPDKMTSWEFFEFMLSRLNIAGTPGVGFGPSGEGYFRLTAFNTYENTLKAVFKLKEYSNSNKTSNK